MLIDMQKNAFGRGRASRGENDRDDLEAGTT
jgi:hypothetical protein